MAPFLWHELTQFHNIQYSRKKHFIKGDQIQNRISSSNFCCLMISYLASTAVGDVDRITISVHIFTVEQQMLSISDSRN